MSNPSRARLSARPLTIAAALAASISLAVPGHAQTHKSTAPVLPGISGPATIVHSTTTTTTTTTTKTAPQDNYNWAAPPPKLPTKTIYDGQSAAKSGLTIAAWGGGSGAVTSDMSYGKGGNAIKVVTHNMYEGAKINFDPGVALNSVPGNNRVLQLLVRFAQAGDEDDSDDTGKADPIASPLPRTYAVDGGDGVTRGAEYDPMSRGLLHLAQGPRPNYIPPGGYQGGYPGAYPGYPGARYPGGPGTRRRGGQSPVAPQTPAYPGYGRTPAPVSSDDATWNPPIHNFRILFTLQDGAQAEIVRPTPWPTAFDDPDTAWLSIGVPLSLLKFGDSPDSSPLSSITIGGDGPATFYIGQINLVSDDAPIICSAGPTQDVAAGDDVSFQARAQGGATMLVYSWDFDTTDGITDDAEGAVAHHKYDKGNKDYTVTLTVSDLDGIKKPCTSTVKIKVEE